MQMNANSRVVISRCASGFRTLGPGLPIVGALCLLGILSGKLGHWKWSLHSSQHGWKPTRSSLADTRCGKARGLPGEKAGDVGRAGMPGFWGHSMAGVEGRPEHQTRKEQITPCTMIMVRSSGSLGSLL